MPGKPGVKLKEVWCRNPRCRWFNTPWVVQVNPDGTIPVYQKGPKQFEPMSADSLSRGRMIAEDAVQRDLEENKKEEAG